MTSVATLSESPRALLCPATRHGHSLQPRRRGWREALSSALNIRSLQLAIGAVWLLDGLLQLQPHMFTSSFVTQVLEPSSQGQAGWISWLVGANAHLVSTNVVAWNTLFACAQLLIGLGLMFRQTVKAALALSFAWSLGVWALGEGFGMIFTGNASPLMGAPGAAVLYAVIGLIAWPTNPERLGSRSAGSRSDDSIFPSVGLRDRSSSAASSGMLGDLGGLIAWGGLWTFYAVLWLLPANTARGAVGRQISSMATGEPSWLSHLLGSAGRLFASTTTANAISLAAVSLIIGLGPLVSRRAAPYLFAGGALSLLFWVFGQAFGGILTGPISGTATDPNAGPLVLLMALSLLPATRRGDRDLLATSGYPQTPTKV